MRSTTKRETDREHDEVTLLELGAGEWDERQLHRGPVRHLAEGDDGADDGELGSEGRGSCCDRGCRHCPYLDQARRLSG